MTLCKYHLLNNNTKNLKKDHHHFKDGSGKILKIQVNIKN